MTTCSHYNYKCDNNKNTDYACVQLKLSNNTVSYTSNSTPLNPEANSFTTMPPTSASLYVCANKSIFLQTALAKIYNPFDPKLVMTVRVLLDSGSQRSYVNYKVKNVLDLKPQTVQQLSIATFGAGKESCLCETIKVAMKMKHGSDQEFKMLVVPQICEPISPQPLSICVENCEHLSQLELADPGSGCFNWKELLLGVVNWGGKAWCYRPSSHGNQIGMGTVWPRPLNPHRDPNHEPYHYSHSNNRS